MGCFKPWDFCFHLTQVGEAGSGLNTINVLLVLQQRVLESIGTKDLNLGKDLN